jgi:hypothetical protein
MKIVRCLRLRGKARYSQTTIKIGPRRITCRLIKATDTHSECVIFIAFPRQNSYANACQYRVYTSVVYLYWLYFWSKEEKSRSRLSVRPHFCPILVWISVIDWWLILLKSVILFRISELEVLFYCLFIRKWFQPVFHQSIYTTGYLQCLCTTWLV